MFGNAGVDYLDESLRGSLEKRKKWFGSLMKTAFYPKMNYQGKFSNLACHCSVLLELLNTHLLV